jgi:polysaccharide export outer membrane protein
MRTIPRSRLTSVLAILALLAGCASNDSVAVSPSDAARETSDYVIAPGDTVNVFVWQNPDLSTTVQVRPDGKLSIPLVEDLQASGKTSTQLADDIETVLGNYVRSPNVTVILASFGIGAYGNQIRIVGSGAARPQAIAFRDGLTLLDVMIEVGLAEFAAGNRSTLVRRVNNEQRQTRLRLDDLLNRGDLSQNILMLPGDIVIIPETRL